MLDDLLLRRNLIDAGFDDHKIEEFLSLKANDDLDKKILILKSHRRHLLSCMQLRESQLDCLDFLIHKLTVTDSGNKATRHK